MDSNDRNNAAFVYSVNMLKLLLKMSFINEEEYQRIVEIGQAHYGVENICI